MYAVIVSVVLFVIAQSIAGIGVVVRMWNSQNLLKADIQARDDASKARLADMQRQVDDLHLSEKTGQADMNGLSLQISNLSALLGEIRGELRMIVRQSVDR